MSDIEEIHQKLREFTEARDWKQYHTPPALARSVVIEAAELLELFQWSDNFNYDRVTEELADVLIYCFMLADVLNLDIKRIMEFKIAANSLKYPVDKAMGSAAKYTEF